jgi:hypothetical protein
MPENDKPQQNPTYLPNGLIRCCDSKQLLALIDFSHDTYPYVTFFQKASKDWIHSPKLESIVERLIMRYSIFFQLIAGNPKRIAVPNLDIDLAWHILLLFIQADQGPIY